MSDRIPPKGMTLNPKLSVVARVIKAINENNGYCPCSLLKNKDTICPCKEARENQKCICKLFIKGEEN